MRFHTVDAARVITNGSFSLEVVLDVYYGAVCRKQNLPVTDWMFAGDYDANIKTSASAVVVYQGELADSISPEELDDLLAPFGQEVRAFAVVSAGSFSERIPMGVYRIDEDPESSDSTYVLDERVITVGSRVQISLMDRFYAIDVPTRQLEAPRSVVSAWAEITRLSGQVVTRTVPDVQIPRSVVYPRNRLAAVQQLAGVLGGRAYMRADGTLGVIPDVFPFPSIGLAIGEESGTIIRVSNGMTSSGVFNAVYGDFEDVDGNGIHVEAAVTSGALSIYGPYGERPVEYPSDQKEFIRTRAAAQTAVDNHLKKVSTRGPRELTVEVIPDPRIEIGDVVALERPDGSSLIGRVVKSTLTRDSPLILTVRVPYA